MPKKRKRAQKLKKVVKAAKSGLFHSYSFLFLQLELFPLVIDYIILNYLNNLPLYRSSWASKIQSHAQLFPSPYLPIDMSVRMNMFQSSFPDQIYLVQKRKNIWRVNMKTSKATKLHFETLEKPESFGEEGETPCFYSQLFLDSNKTEFIFLYEYEIHGAGKFYLYREPIPDNQSEVNLYPYREMKGELLGDAANRSLRCALPRDVYIEHNFIYIAMEYKISIVNIQNFGVFEISFRSPEACLLAVDSEDNYFYIYIHDEISGNQIKMGKWQFMTRNQKN